LTAAGAIAAVRAIDVAASAKGVWSFVEVTSAEGLIGTGEATVHRGQELVPVRLRALAAELVGRPAARSSLGWAAPGSTDFADVSARCAVDQALADLEAQAAGRSIARLLCAAPRPRVEVYANVNRRTGDRTPDGFAASAGAAAGAGFRAVKIAPLDGLQPATPPDAAAALVDQAVERIAAVRARIGAGCRLLVDCHWRLTPASARRLLHAVVPLDVFWIECPFPEEPGHFDALRSFRRVANARGVRTAGCELLRGLDGFAPYVEGELYDVLMPDVKHAGGYGELLAIAAAAAARGIAIAPHNPTGPVAHAHSVQASAALDGFLLLEMQFDETPLFTAIVEGELPMPRDGVAAVPDRDGLGLRLAATAARP
jgi:galactonate dehydratase